MKFQGKKVLVLGLGLNEGGVGSAKFFAGQGADVLVTDVKNQEDLKPSLKKLKDFPNIKYHLGGHKTQDIDWADLIVRNQGVKPNNPFLKYARDKQKEITTDVGIFLESVSSSQIIGVTGTKGKSTTSSLIYEVLKTGGKKVILSGNIGKSVLDSISIVDPDTLVVLEISSFQLESFDEKKTAPKYAIITNIYPDHLNYYSSIEEYTAAKKLIAKNQNPGDFLFINKNDHATNNSKFLDGVKSKIILYSIGDLPDNFKPFLPGEYNLSNIAAALAVCKTLGIAEDIILKTLQDFKGVRFRLELVKDWSGVKIYNNTTATAPEPAIESLKTFPGSILICGGMNKGLNYKEFAEAIDKYAKSVYFLDGDATAEITKHLKNLKSKILNPKSVYKDLEGLLKDIKSVAKSGEVILFSPGATSFNLFQNEFDRGKKFNEAVERVFNE